MGSEEDLISFLCVCFIQDKILNIKNKTTNTKATWRLSIFGPPSCLQKRVNSIQMNVILSLVYILETN